MLCRVGYTEGDRTSALKRRRRRRRRRRRPMLLLLLLLATYIYNILSPFLFIYIYKFLLVSSPAYLVKGLLILYYLYYYYYYCSMRRTNLRKRKKYYSDRECKPLALLAIRRVHQNKANTQTHLLTLTLTHLLARVFLSTTAHCLTELYDGSNSAQLVLEET